MRHTFTGVLTAADCKRHLPHAFDVPENVARVQIRLEFTPARVDGVRNMLTLTVFDPSGFRGAGHRGGNSHLVELSQEFATPGYFAGPTPPGHWIAQIDTHMVMAGEPCSYELEIELTTGSHPSSERRQQAHHAPAAAQSLRQSLRRGPGWYRGDLHSHTDHSDGHRNVADLVATARAYGLDFICLTDHNTVSGLAEMAQLGGVDLLTLGGMELTTFWGHAVCLGTREWLDWRVERTGDGMSSIAEAVQARRELFIVAHPMDQGDPVCTGCRWLYSELMPGPARLVEIWNEAWGDGAKNPAGLALWYSWLNQGHRLVATAGSDTHGAQDYAERPGFTVIFAQELSEREILNGLRAGHAYLSSGPALTLTAHGDDGDPVMIGETARGASVEFLCTWSECPVEARLEVIADGATIAQRHAGGQGRHAWTLTPQAAHWCVVELRGDRDQLLAISNPIYLSAV